MADLTIVTLCQVLANITHNRCHLVENSHTCRCTDDIMPPRSTTIVSTAPEIMMSEVLLIFFVLGLWLSAIGFCLNQYKSLRRLETQVHYCVNRKDPLNIGEIKIVAREQDSIIYKKKRYSTVLDTHIDNDQLKKMNYVQEYLPHNFQAHPSTLSALVVDRNDLTANVPLTTTNAYNSLGHSTTSTYVPLTTHREIAEEQQPPSSTSPPPPASFATFILYDTEFHTPNERITLVQRTAHDVRLTAGLTVPQVSTPGSGRLSWNGPPMSETSLSAQHLSVPGNTLRYNRYSDGNISLPVPQSPHRTCENTDEQLLDPRLIPRTVRRSLLALHRESQENINMNRSKEKTQSENDVHGAFTPWKIKMKSKLKRTHHHQQVQQSPPQHQHYPTRPHSNTLSVLPIRHNSNDQERRISEYASMNSEYRFSTPPLRNSTVSMNPSPRRSLKHYPKYSTQSTTESEPTPGDLPMITSVYVSIDDDETKKTILKTDASTPLTSL